jgi:hypothetical protein
MIVAPRSCWRAWLWRAQVFVFCYRPLQAHHPVTFVCNRTPQLDRVAFRKPLVARRSSLGPYCQGSALISIVPT